MISGRLYPGGWDDPREESFRQWYGDLRKVDADLPDNPDQDGEGLERRRTYLETQLKMQPEASRP